MGLFTKKQSDFEIYDDATNKTILVRTSSLKRAEEIASRWEFEDLKDGELLDVDKGLKVDDIVHFNPYPEQELRKPTKGRINRIGTTIELGMSTMSEDNRVIYELETVGEKRSFIFTRTSGRWINKVGR